MEGARHVSRELTDTSPEIAEYHRAALGRLRGEDRLRMACGMFETARALVLGSLPQEVREDSTERRIHFFRRFYGRDLEPAFFEAVVRRIKAEGRSGPDGG